MMARTNKFVHATHLASAFIGKGVKSDIWVIYAYFEENDKIKLIEIYYKGDKESEDRERILRYYK